MTHVQIDDAIFDHPKWLRVSKDAKLLGIAAICYCGNMLTDGFVPTGAVPVLGARTCVTKTKSAVDELIAAGLWETTEGGFRVHHYLDYNASADKVQANKDAARARMQRLRSHDVRANNGRSSENVRDTTTTTTSTGSDEPENPPSSPPENLEAAKQKRRHRLPEDWEPADNQRQALAAEGYSAAEIAAEIPKFQRHHWHKGDTGLNWALAFSNWMAKSREFSRTAPAAANGMPPEIARLGPQNADRLKWEYEHRPGRSA